MLARVGLAYISWGSSDTSLFRKYSREISEHGLLWEYHFDKGFNHPPLPGYYIELIYRLTEHTTSDDRSLRQMGFRTFPFVFKMPDVAADAIICWLLYKILLPRRGARFAAIAAVCYAWSPVSILITGHECNTDPIYILLMLLSLWLIEDRAMDFTAGLVMAAAINVKLIPLLVIIPLVGTYHDWKRLVRFLVGLSVAVAPFIPFVLIEPYRFYRHVIAYGSAMDYWGINEFLLETGSQERFRRIAYICASGYYVKGRWVVLAAVVLMTLRARRSGRYNAYTLAAGAGALFMILTPGFGLQYLILLVPLMLATGRLSAANFYSAFAGLFLLFAYW